MLVRTFQTFGFTLGRQRDALMIAANSGAVSVAVSAFHDKHKESAQNRATEIPRANDASLAFSLRESILLLS